MKKVSHKSFVRMGSKVYKIISKKTGKPVTLGGYKSKASWQSWPSEAISRMKDPDDHFVQEYDVIKARRFDVNRKDLIDIETVQAVDKMMEALNKNGFAPFSIFVRRETLGPMLPWNSVMFLINELDYIKKEFLQMYSVSRSITKGFDHEIEFAFCCTGSDRVSDVENNVMADGFINFDELLKNVD